MNCVKYISYDDALTIYEKTIEKSGGGLCGVHNDGGIRSALEFIQNDDYYPSYTDKLTYLVFSFCSGHFFCDGNKRVALTLGTYFLHINGYHWEASIFMKHFEAFVYHVAASRIEQDLLRRIMRCFLERIDHDEDLKLDIIRAIDK